MGLLRDKNNDVFLGEFKYGKPEGKGTFIKKDEFNWKGEFKDGKAIGEGVFYNYTTKKKDKGTLPSNSFKF